MMVNPDAMLIVMQGGDPASIDMSPDVQGDRYERLFALRDEAVTVHRNNEDGAYEGELEARIESIFDHLVEHFGEMPDAEDQERAREIIAGLFANPREIEDLVENQIAVIEDTAVNVGVVRSLLYSYGINLDSPQFYAWVVRYRLYMVV